MDYNDYKNGMTDNHFWMRGKVGLIDTLFRKIASQENFKILNIGAGTGSDLSVMRKYGDVHVLDIDKNALNMIPDNLVKSKTVGDVCKIPYDNNSFDIVVMFDVLEHIEDDALAIEEICRILKNGGHFIFTVPAFPVLFHEHDRQLNHFRRYNKEMLSDLLRKFSSVKLGYWFSSLFFPVAFYRLLTRHVKKDFVSQQKDPSFVLNQILYGLLKIENLLIFLGMKLPFGLSLYGIYKK